MVDITSNILKDIFSKKLNKAKEGIAKSLRNKSFKAIEDYKNSFSRNCMLFYKWSNRH